MYNNIGIIGFPLSHTFSPTIHAHYLDMCGLNGGYACFCESDSNNLGNLLQMLNKYNFIGVNVTVPYKVDIMQYCKQLDNTAKIANAVNTLKFCNDGIVGYNTDIYGVSKMFSNADVSIIDKNVLIIGAGGATGAVLAHMVEHKPKSVTIANRTIEKAKKLSENFDINIDVCSLDMIKNCEFDIVINSTSLGLDGGEFTNYGFICSEALVDLQYQADITPFLASYTKNKVKLINGLDMLIYQAYQSFNIWTGCDFVPDVDKLRKLYYNHIGK